MLEKRYNEKCDVWSCGVILYVILTGIPPFNGNDDDQIMEKVSNGSYTLSIPEFDNVSNLAKKLIKKMLEYNPNKRVSAYEAINDEWFHTMKTQDSKGINLSTLNNLRKLNVRTGEEIGRIFLIFFSIRASCSRRFTTLLSPIWLPRRRSLIS